MDKKRKIDETKKETEKLYKKYSKYIIREVEHFSYDTRKKYVI